MTASTTDAVQDSGYAAMELIKAAVREDLDAMDGVIAGLGVDPAGAAGDVIDLLAHILAGYMVADRNGDAADVLACLAPYASTHDLKPKAEP